MPQPPTSPVISRELVRIIPFTQQHTIINAAAGAGAQFIAAFDCGAKTTDPNQLLVGANPSGDPTQFVIGTLLDACVFTTGPGGGTLLVEYGIDAGAAYRAVANTIAVNANQLANIAGLRITARFVRVTFTNVSAGALVEFGAYVRSQ